MTGTFSNPIYKEQFFKIADTLKNDNNFGRIFWIPSRAPLGFASPDHPSTEALRFFFKKPFAVGNVGTYEIFNFLREAPFTGELFKISGIKYISYPYPDTRREDLKKDNIDYYYVFLDQISNLPWIESKIYDAPTPLLKVKDSKDHLFIAPHTYFIVGSDRIYWDLVKIPEFDLSKNALIFSEEKPGTSKSIDTVSNAKIILYDKNEIDLTSSLINKSKFIFPASNLNISPSTEMNDTPNSRWWKKDTTDFLWWRNFLQEKYGLNYQDFDYGGGWAIAEGNQKLIIKNDKLHEGDMLLARVMNSVKGGILQFYQNEKLGGEIETNRECIKKDYIKLTGYGNIPDKFFEYDCAYLFWNYVGKLRKSGEITIETGGDINVINAIVGIPEGEFQLLESKIPTEKIFKWYELSESEKKNLFEVKSQPEINYQMINPAHFRVSIDGIVLPVTLAFSETYDPLWEIEEQETGKKNKSYPLYSLINGFAIEKNGEYDVYFSPQKYVLPGLVVSGVSLFSILALLIFLGRRKKIKAP